MQPPAWMLQASCVDAADARFATSGHPEASYDWVLLPRHGLRPLAAPARLLLHADNRCRSPRDWSELMVYETISARFVVALRHVSGCGLIWRHAWHCADPEALRACIAAHDPLDALPADVGWAAAACQPTIDGHVVADKVAALKMAWAGLLAAVFGLRLLDQPGSCLG